MIFTEKKCLNHINVQLNDNIIPNKNTIQILGVYFDRKINWIPHLRHLKISLTRNFNIMKMISHTSWGGDEHTLIKTHKQLIRAKLEFITTLNRICGFVFTSISNWPSSRNRFRDFFPYRSLVVLLLFRFVAGRRHNSTHCKQKNHYNTILSCFCVRNKNWLLLWIPLGHLTFKTNISYFYKTRWTVR